MAVCGEAWLYKLPEIEDPNPLDKISIYFDPGPAVSFLSFDLPDKLLYIDANTTTVD